MRCFECFGRQYPVKGLSSQEWVDLGDRTGLPQGVLSKQSGEERAFVFSDQGPYFGLHQAGYVTVESQPLEVLAEIVKARMLGLTALAHREFLFLRGEVLRTPSGKAVVLPGPSLVGKSRLAKELVKSGASRWSRGVIVIDSEGRLLPYPSSFVPSERLEVEGVGLVTYDPKSDWSPEILSAGQTALALIPTVLLPTEDTGAPLAVLGKLCVQANWRCRGSRGEAAGAGDLFAAVRAI